MSRKRAFGILLVVFSAAAMGAGNAGKGMPTSQGPVKTAPNPNVTKLLQKHFTKNTEKLTPRGVKNPVVLKTGSLRSNITRLAKAFGWKTVVWHAPCDYTWQGATTAQAKNITGVMRRLLQHYPLQAVFYRGNHVLLIRARNQI